MNPKVSIIIPVYNEEKYLKQCLDSVINQTLSDIEIICVNDGSTDSSLDILQDYSRKDSRIKIITQENMGLSCARNVGLKHSTGEYIQFLDSDDWIDLNSSEKLYNQAKKDNLDLLIYQSINYSQLDDKFYEDDYYNNIYLPDTFNNTVFSHEDIKDYLFSLAVNAYSKLYRRSLIEKYHIRFPEKLYYEDNPFHWECLLIAKRISITRNHYTIRRRHNNSITSTLDDKIYDTVKISQKIVHAFKKYDKYEQYKSGILNKQISYLYHWYKQLDDNYKREYANRLHNLFIKLNNTTDDYQNNLNYENKTFFNALINSANIKTTDYALNVSNTEYRLKEFENSLKEKERKLKISEDSLKDKSEKINLLEQQLIKKEEKLQDKYNQLNQKESKLKEDSITLHEKENKLKEENKRILEKYDILLEKMNDLNKQQSANTIEIQNVTNKQIADMSAIFVKYDKKQNQLFELLNNENDLYLQLNKNFKQNDKIKEFIDDSIINQDKQLKNQIDKINALLNDKLSMAQKQYIQNNESYEKLLQKEHDIKEAREEYEEFCTLKENEFAQKQKELQQLHDQLHIRQKQLQDYYHNKEKQLNNKLEQLNIIKLHNKLEKESIDNKIQRFQKKQLDYELSYNKKHEELLNDKKDLLVKKAENKNEYERQINKFNQEKLQLENDKLKLDNDYLHFNRKMQNTADKLNRKKRILDKKSKDNELILQLKEEELKNNGGLLSRFKSKTNIYVSIIIPVYNCEDYLAQCLDSLISQTLENIEIICINDGSTDKSGEILKEYQKKDSRIKVFNQVNSGQGVARNRAINMAQGEYILFVDSDDWIKADACKQLYKQAKVDNLDMLLFLIENYSENDNVYYEDDYYNLKCLSDFDDGLIFNYHDLGEKVFEISISPCQKLYKRSLLENIRFPENIFFEDNAFYWDSILASKNISITRKHYYIRRRRSNSTTSSYDEKYLDTVKSSQIVMDIFDKYNLMQSYRKEVVYYKVNYLYRWYNKMDEEYKEKYYQLMHDDFKLASQNKLLHENILKYSTEYNKKFYLDVLHSNSSDELEYLQKYNK